MSVSNLSATVDSAFFAGSTVLLGSFFDEAEAGPLVSLGNSGCLGDVGRFGSFGCVVVSLGEGFSSTSVLEMLVGFAAASSVCESARKRALRRWPEEKPDSKLTISRIPTARTIPHQTGWESRTVRASGVLVLDVR